MGHENSGWYRTVKMTPRQRKEAVFMAISGKPISEIVKKYGVSRSYIYSLLKPKTKKTP